MHPLPCASFAPAGQPIIPHINPSEVKKALDAAKPQADVSSKLLAGTNAVSLIGESAIPPVSGVSDYDKPMKDGKLVVQFPINVWPGWAPIIVANGCSCVAISSLSQFTSALRGTSIWCHHLFRRLSFRYSSIQPLI